MTLIFAAKKAVFLWEIRLLATAALTALFSGMLFAFFGMIASVFPIIAFPTLIFFAFVTPKYFSSFQCELTQNEITITSGFFKVKKRTIPLNCIQFTELSATPLEKQFKIATITIYLSGTKTKLHSLSADSAALLLHRLKGE